MKAKIIIDEEKYGIAWRFNADDCKLQAEDINKIIFLDSQQSSTLWRSTFNFKTLQTVKKEDKYYEIIKEAETVFFEGSDFVFSQIVEQEKLIFFFWGIKSSAILTSDIFLKSWDDFFYPSDENCILYLPSSNTIIFSFNEIIFFAKLL